MVELGDDAFKWAFHQAPVGMMLLDSNCVIHSWNHWLEEKTGKQAEEVIGHALSDLYPESANPRFVWALEQVIQNNAQQVLSHALNRYLIPIKLTYDHGGELDNMPQQIYLAPIMGHKLALVSILDITENVVRAAALMEIAQKLEQESIRDPLTNAYNRRFMWEWLSQRKKVIVPRQRPVGCLLLDIDFFKKLNDNYGHVMGDNVLKRFAEVIDRSLRADDILVRYGGEEFVVLLSDVTFEMAVSAAERIRAAIENEAFSPLKAGGVTCSIGVSYWDPVVPREAEEFINEADEKLYMSKENGRNQVTPKGSEI